MKPNEYIGWLSFDSWDRPDKRFRLKDRAEHWAEIKRHVLDLRSQCSYGKIYVRIKDGKCIGHVYFTYMSEGLFHVNLDVHGQDAMLIRCREICEYYLGGEWTPDLHIPEHYIVEVL
jgi:hypothetical protein